MTEDLKIHVIDLEARLKRLEDEKRTMAESYESTLQEEQTRANEREEQHEKTRKDLTDKNLQLTQELVELKGQLAALQSIEDEVNRLQGDVKQSKRDNADIKAKSLEERKNFEEQINDKRRQIDKQAQEVSDLKCQISILEHKYQHAAAKLTHQDVQTDELTRTQDELTRCKLQLDNTERTLNAESQRFAKDRRALEEKVERLQNDLAQERQEPTKQQLIAKHETAIDTKTRLLRKALHALPSGGHPVPDANDSEQVSRFLESCSSACASPGASPNRARSSGGFPITDDIVGPIAVDLIRRMKEGLAGLNEDKQVVLLRRFLNTVQANTQQSRSFGETSGFPDSNIEDRATLVNHIAVVTAERDALIKRNDGLHKEIEAIRAGRTTSDKRDNDDSSSPTATKEGSSSPTHSSSRTRASPGGVGSGRRRQ